MKRLLITFLFLLSATLCPAQTLPHWLQIQGKPFIDVRNYGAKGDGTTDDTIAIQTALDSETHLSFPDGYTFKIMDTLSVTSDDVHLLGLGGSVLLGTSSQRLFDVTGDNFTADSMIVSGPEVRFTSATESTYGFHFEDLDGAVVRNCKISWFTYGIKSQNASNVLVTHSDFKNNLPLTTGEAGYGFLSGGAGSVYQTISECNFEENRHAIYFSSGSSHCKALNNNITNSWAVAIGNYAKEDQPRAENLLISGNTIRGKENSELASIQHGISVVENVGRVTISDNYISNIPQYGIWLETNQLGSTTVSDVLVSNNHILDCAQGGIYQQRCEKIIYSGNIIYNARIALAIAGTNTASPSQVVGQVQFYGNSISSTTLPLSIAGGSENIIGPIKLGVNQFDKDIDNDAYSLIESEVLDLSALYGPPLRFTLTGVASTTSTNMEPTPQLWGTYSKGYIMRLKYSNGPITGSATGTLTIGGLTYPPSMSMASGSSTVFGVRPFQSIVNPSPYADVSFSISTSEDFGPTPGTFTLLLIPIDGR